MKWIVTSINPVSTKFGTYWERTLESKCGRFTQTTTEHKGAGIGQEVKDCYRDAPTRLADRLKLIGIECELHLNVPWVYLHKVNGKIVEGKMHSEHNFCVGFLHQHNLVDKGKVFDKIRSMVKD